MWRLQNMHRNLKLITLTCAFLCGLSLFAAAAQACPMCSQSIADDDRLPHAFMYSILFMLGMPATVALGIGTMIYIKFRQFHAAQQIGVAGDNLVSLPPRAETGAAETCERV
jgi:hypothetical protein